MHFIGENWEMIKQTIHTEYDLTNISYNTWIEPLQFYDVKDDTVYIQIPTGQAHALNYISNKYSNYFKVTISEMMDHDYDISFILEKEKAADTDTDLKSPSSNINNINYEQANLNPKYKFDTFIVGNNNKFAHSACLAVAESPGNAYNPLFIYGNSGLGKTHLLLAIGQYIRENNPGAKIAYIKGDEFTNQLLKSIKEGTGEEFRMKYRNVDLFLVDDIQFIAGKQATQEEFFHTFNNIYEAGHQIVITSDRPPIEMSLLDDRLMSRFQGGLMADIQPPDIETRMVITRAKAAQLGLVLEDDAVAYIAETITSNVRQIEGVIKRLTAYREILDSTIDTAAVKRAIKDVVRIGTFIPSPQLIIRESARYFQLSEEDLRGQNRSKATATARQISMYLIRTLTNLPLKEIGAEYGDRNHSTVLSSIRKVEEMIKEDPMYSAAVRDITSNINSQ